MVLSSYRSKVETSLKMPTEGLSGLIIIMPMVVTRVLPVAILTSVHRHFTGGKGAIILPI
jgi:hypothetical protein